jgi:hypothetical protein
MAHDIDFTRVLWGSMEIVRFWLFSAGLIENYIGAAAIQNTG